MTFDAYLIKKKIDGVGFRQHEPDRFSEWEGEFRLLHPNSFTTQKFYLLNPMRKKYPLKEMQPLIGEQTGEVIPKKVKPVIKSRPKFN